MTEEIEQHVLKRYQVVKKVGSGAYGHVWKVRDRKTGEILALKKIFDAFQHSTDAQRTYREIMFLRMFSHPNIIKLYHVLRAENDKDIYLVFECMEADLHNAIREGILQDLHRQYVIYQCVLALKYLHSGEVIHRDLKPSNVLLNSSCKVKLCDFGLVRSVAKEETASPVLTEYVATRWYRAPEILLGSNEYSKSVDLWSLGCIIAEMVLNKPIFPGNSTLHQLEKILSFTGKPSNEDIDSIRSQLSKTMIDSVSSIKYKSPEDWFPIETDKELVDLIIKLLQFNPTKRLTCDEILSHPYVSHFRGKDAESQVVVKEIFYVEKDQEKLTTKDYRQMIYETIKEDKNLLKEESGNAGMSGSGYGIGTGAGFGNKQLKDVSPTYKDSKFVTTKQFGSIKQGLTKNDKPSSKEALLSTKDTSPKKFTTNTYTYIPSSNLKSKLDKEKSIQNVNNPMKADKSPSFINKINPTNPILSQTLAEKYAKIVDDRGKEQKYIKPSSFLTKDGNQSPSYINGPSGISYYSPKASYEKVSIPVKANSPTYKYTFGEKKEGSGGYGSGTGTGTGSTSPSYSSALEKYKSGLSGLKDKS